ncbi:MAG: energy transducer TonB [Sphingobacteriales bacterium]|nr:MAG: energy transducer TonB [Sphingobacteriales bacterium]
MRASCSVCDSFFQYFILCYSFCGAKVLYRVMDNDDGCHMPSCTTQYILCIFAPNILLPMKLQAFILATFWAATAATAQIKDKTVTNKTAEAPTIFRFVEVMPEPPFDVSGYISEHLKYPDTAIKEDIEGRINVMFVVDTKGRITDVKTMGRRLGYGLEEEAIRVVRSMPAWKPGQQQGVPVNVYFTLPISFKLEDDKEEKK